MLNVPESVKALFKQDGIRKNFRVQFPGGELPDITNDNVVQESVRFTESLCSQDVLKFGLTEASVLEFETVGVANMYGMTIEAGIEIDLSSLSAAELAEIEAGSWDGVYVSESDTDLGFPFFRVPYGVFRVESCPRDHQAMAHRKVQAYSFGGKLRNSQYELAKLAKMTGSTYAPDIVKLIYAATGWYASRYPEELTATPYTAWETWPPLQNVLGGRFFYYSVRLPGGLPPADITVESLNFYGAMNITFGTGSNIPWDALYALELNGPTNLETAFSEFTTFFDAQESEFLQSHRSEVLAAVKDFLSVHFSTAGTLSSFISSDAGLPIFYPKGLQSYLTIPASMTIRMSYTVTLGQSTRRTVSLPVTILEQEPTLYTFTGLPDPVLIQIKKTGTDSEGDGTFINSYDLTKLANGYLELCAEFGKIQRTSEFKMARLSKDAPVSVIPGEFSGFWWDEYDVLPIGSVTFDYLNADNQSAQTDYEFGPGPSVYDATGNELLKAMPDQTQETVISLLDENFVPYLDPITFTPIDLEMKGLPYLEAGDYLAVTAEDGTIANSFAMRQTISGIQVLTAEIESTSGDIIESEEGET